MLCWEAASRHQPFLAPSLIISCIWRMWQAQASPRQLTWPKQSISVTEKLLYMAHMGGISAEYGLTW